jgi:hypothetical protein
MKLKLFTIGILVFSLSMSACNKKGGEEESNKVLYENAEEGDASGNAEKPAAATQAVTTMAFTETEHDFGTINEGDMASHTFTFKNTGKTPLIISDAKADCGCTVPSWTKEPVLPGQDGKIDVKYNSSGKGGQTVSKTVTVYANTDPAENKLIIKAKVKAKGGAPLKK